MVALRWCLVIFLCGACGTTATTGGSNGNLDSASVSMDADAGAVGCPEDVTTCGDRVCQKTESAACCAFDCNNNYYSEASCIGTSCHTEMLNCRSDASCMAAVDCALACKGGAACIADCGNFASAKVQLLFKCVNATACWHM